MKLVLSKEEAIILLRAAQFTSNSAQRRIQGIMQYSYNKKQAQAKCDEIYKETLGVKELYQKIKNHFNIEINDEQE